MSPRRRLFSRVILPGAGLRPARGPLTRVGGAAAHPAPELSAGTSAAASTYGQLPMDRTLGTLRTGTRPVAGVGDNYSAPRYGRELWVPPEIERRTVGRGAQTVCSVGTGDTGFYRGNDTGIESWSVAVASADSRLSVKCNNELWLIKSLFTCVLSQLLFDCKNYMSSGIFQGNVFY